MADILSEYDRRRRREDVVPPMPDADPDPETPTGTMPTLDDFRTEFASYNPGGPAVAAADEEPDLTPAHRPRPHTSVPPPAMTVARGARAPLPPDAGADADPWGSPAGKNESIAAPRAPHLAPSRRASPPEPDFLAKIDDAPDEAPADDAAPPDDEAPAAPPARTVRYSAETPEKQGVSAPAGSGGDAPSRAPFSEYDALKKALGEQDAQAGDDSYSWISKAGEDVNAAFMRRKPNYDVANELDAQAASRRGAPGRRFQQTMALEGARERDGDRAPLGDSYLDTLGAPHGLNKAQIKEFMDRRVQAANVKHLEQEPKVDKELGGFAMFKADNPTGTYAEYLRTRGEASAPVLAAGVHNEGSAKVQGLKNQIAEKEIALKTAQGKQKIQLQMDLAEIKAALTREEGAANRASHERVAGQNLDAAEKRFQAGQDFKEAGEIRKSVPDQLVDSVEAVKQIKAMGPQSVSDVSWTDRLARAIPFGIGEQFADPKALSTMSKEDAFQKFQVRMETGLAMTDAERAEAKQRFGLRAFSDPALFREMMGWYENLGNKKLAQRQAGFSEHGLAKAKAAGGTVSDTALDAAGGLPPLEPGFARVSNGTETLDIPESDVADAQADGYKRVR